MQDFSPELRLLLALLRAALGTGKAAVPAAPDPIHWPRFLALVERHRVGAFLHQRATSAVATACPPGVQARLKEISQATVHRALAQAAEQIRLTQTLAAAGVDVIALKGLVLAQELYGGLGRRHVGDIDLFVRRRDAQCADAVLRKSGLRRTRPDFVLTPRQTKEFLRRKPEFEYVREAPAVRIELLWRLEGLPEIETAAAWNRTIPAQLGGHPVRTLEPGLDALYLLQHGARHGWFRLFWLLDAALLFQARSFDWSAVMKEARAFGLERSLLQAAALVSEFLSVMPPAVLAPRPAERPAVAALVREARRQINREVPSHENLGEWSRQLAYRVRLQRHGTRKLAVLAPHVFTPESWRMWPLPDRCFFLYSVATPVLWLWRRLQR